MKVLMISSDKSILDSNSDAAQRMKDYGSLAERLDIIVCCPKGAHNGDVAQISENTSAHPTNSSSKLWYVWDVLRTAKKIGASDVDLVTAQDPFEIGLAGWLIARRLKAKLQLQIHTDFLSPYFSRESLKNRIRVILAKFLLPKADGIRVVSERIKKSLTAYGLQLMAVILPIFVDAAKIKSSPITIDLRKKYPQFDFIILMASRLEKEKNIGLSIRVLSDVVKKYPNIGLVIAGAGSQEKSLRLMSYDLCLQDNVIFEGWVNDLPSCFKTSDAYLLCSNYEGYGMTLIMAAAAGCPIIATNVGIIGEIINKKNALILDVCDKGAIMDAILKLRLDESLRKDLKRRALEAVRAIGTKEEYLKKYKSSWEAIIKYN